MASDERETNTDDSQRRFNDAIAAAWEIAAAIEAPPNLMICEAQRLRSCLVTLAKEQKHE